MQEIQASQALLISRLRSKSAENHPAPKPHWAARMCRRSWTGCQYRFLLSRQWWNWLPHSAARRFHPCCARHTAIVSIWVWWLDCNSFNLTQIIRAAIECLCVTDSAEQQTIKPISDRTFKISLDGEKQRVDLFANIQVLLYDQTLWFRCSCRRTEALVSLGELPFRGTTLEFMDHCCAFPSSHRLFIELIIS